MSKITITLEDRKDGLVRVVVNPSMEQMAKMLWEFDGKGKPVREKRKPTAAEAYTLKSMDAIRAASKMLDKLSQSKIVKPGSLLLP